MAFETEDLSRQSAGRKRGVAGLAARRRHLLMSTLLTPATLAVLLGLGTHAFAVPYSVANEAELRAALSSGDATTITFTGDIVVTQAGGGDLPAVQGNVTIDGGGHSLSGDGANRGLLVYGDSNVRIQDLTIKDTAATGGAGGSRAGGGAGLGGGLFVHSDSNVTLSNVTFEDNSANGGDGGSDSSFDGGGGGIGGNGGQPGVSGGGGGGGGGGLGNQAHGGTGDGSAGGGGIVTGAPAAAAGENGGAGGPDGGGGGGGAGLVNPSGGGGGIGASERNGGFGGGGGGGGLYGGGDGGFGGGGGGALGGNNGGSGGFGGGGGGGSTRLGHGGQGGFGGGNGVPGGGGGGAGFGGAVFVMGGGSLTIEGDSGFSGGAVSGGSGANAGSAAGSGIFLQNAGVTFSSGAGDSQTAADDIADDSGNSGSNGGSITKKGAGGTALSGDIDIAGTVTVEDGTLALSGDNAIDGGIIVGGGGPGTSATLSLLSDGAAGGADGRITTKGSVVDYGDGVTMATPIDLDSDDTQLQVLTGAAEQSGIIAELNGPRPLEKVGDGTLTLSAANSYTGATTVTAGTLVVTGSLASTDIQVGGGATFRVDHADDGTADAGALSDAAAVTVATDGIFDVAADETLNSVTSNGTIDLNDNTLTALGGVTVAAGTVTADAAGGVVETPLFTQNGGTVDENVTVSGDAYVMTAGTLEGTVDSTAFSQTGGDASTATVNSDYRVTAIGGTIAENGPGGIDAENDNGGITIVTTADGDIDNDAPVATGAGIRAATTGAGHAISMTLGGSVRGDTAGIVASTDAAQGTSGVTIDFADDVTGENGHGIAVTSGGAVAVHNTGGSGVTVQGGGSGNAGVSVQTSLTDGLGIHLYGSSGTIVGPADGTVETTGGADILIENWDRIEGQNGDGIRARSNGGDVDIRNVLAVRGAGGDGIDAASAGGGITITGSGTGYTDDNGTPGNPADDTTYTGIVGTGGDGIHADASNAGAGGDIVIGGAGALANGAITGSQDGVEAITDGAGTVTVTAGGAITGQAGTGVVTRTASGQNTVGGSGGIAGVGYGIDASSALGGVTVAGTGGTSASAADSIAIKAAVTDANATADVVVSRSGAVTNAGGGTASGIDARNAGSGKVDIDSGAVTLADTSLGTSINAVSSGGGAITVDNGGALNGGAIGINGQTTGAGTVTVTTGAAIGATDAVSNTGITTSGVDGQNQVNVNHSINADITGVLAQNSGAGLIDINQAAGTTITAGTTGLYVLQSAGGAGGDIDIDTAGTIEGGLRGIFATVGGGTTSGGIAIDALSGADINGVTAISATISNAGNASGIAIAARTGSTIDGGTTAIRANTEGTGAVDITIQSGVTVDQTADTAIIATADEGKVTVTANSAVSSQNGYAVDASTEGGVGASGDVTVTGSGTLSSSNGPGAIRAVSDTGGVHVGGTGQTTAGGANATAIEARISSAFATGDVVVDRSGAIGNTGLGAATGIFARNEGSGDVDIDSGAITLANASLGYGIYASSTGGGNVFVDNHGAINGGATGIEAVSNGAGNVTVTTGAAIGASDSVSGAGIETQTETGTAQIDVGHAIVADTTGVRAIANGGAIDINQSAGLIAAGMTGIDAESLGGQVDIDLTGGAAINSAGTGIRVAGASATVDIGSGASVDGAARALVAEATAATFNNSGTVTSTGRALSVNSGAARLNNLSGGMVTGDLESLLGADSFVDNRAGATFTLNTNGTSTLAGTDRIDNAGLFRATGSTVNGLEMFDNKAGGVFLVNETGVAGSTVTFGGLGLFSNAGTVDLANSPAGGALVVDTLVLDGDYRGEAGSQIAVDIDLGRNNTNGEQLSDQVVVGGSFTGTTNIAFNLLDPTNLGLQDNPIIVVDLDSAQPGAFTSTGLPALGGIVEYQFGQIGEDWGVTSTVNLSAAGGVAANVTLAQSIISIMANRPSSPYVSGLAGIDDYHSGPGFWMRGVAGAARTETSVVDNLGFSSKATVDLTYAGAQLGADLGWFNVGDRDLTVNAGMTAGYNTGRTTQDVVSVFSDRVTSRTDGDFDSRYVGGYVTIAKDRFFADLQARFDRTDFTFDNNNPLLGLNDAHVKSDRVSVNGGIGYAAEIGERLAFVPSVGFSYARTRTTGVTFDNGSTLDPQAYETILGFGGATLVKTFILPDQISAVSPFVTGTVYHDFGDDPSSIFVLGDVSREIANQNLGTFGELSVGADYLRVFGGDGTGAGGPLKQLNANIRADFKFSNRVLAAGVNAQLRLQY
jgi:hypothetical protein